MPSKGRIVYWDSNIFLSFINKIPDRIQTIRDLLTEIQEDAHSFILTSSESIAEVANAAFEKEQSKLNPAIEEQIDAMWDDASMVRIIDNGSHIARIARDLIRDAIPHGWVLKPKDASHLASAYWYNQKVGELKEFHTYDLRLHKYQTMIGIHVDTPHVLQYRMDLEDNDDTE